MTTAVAAIEFVLALGRALHVYGTPAHRLEEAMELCSKELGVKGQFFSTPTAFFAAFEREGRSDTRLIRVGPGVVDLAKLMAVDEVMNDVLNGELRPTDGQARLAEIEARPEPFRRRVRLLAYGGASGSAAVFFGGGTGEVACAAIVGLVIGFLAEIIGRSRTSLSIVEPVSAVIAAAAALSWAAFVTPIDTEITTVATLILLVPGFTLTVAMSELATRNLVSGTARLMFAVIILIGIGFGVAIGRQVGQLLPTPELIPATTRAPLWAECLALTVTALALTICFRARVRETIWIFLSCALAYGGARTVGATGVSPEVAAFTGALLVGLGSSTYARVFDRPSAVTQVPGIMLLVPGSIGFRGVSQIVDRETVTGIDSAFQMVMIGTAIVTGLLVANVLVPRRKIL